MKIDMVIMEKLWYEAAPNSRAVFVGGRGHRSGGMRACWCDWCWRFDDDVVVDQFRGYRGVHSRRQVLNRGHKRASGWLRQLKNFFKGGGVPQRSSRRWPTPQVIGLKVFVNVLYFWVYCDSSTGQLLGRRMQAGQRSLLHIGWWLSLELRSVFIERENRILEGIALRLRSSLFQRWGRLYSGNRDSCELRVRGI